MDNEKEITANKINTKCTKNWEGYTLISDIDIPAEMDTVNFNDIFLQINHENRDETVMGIDLTGCKKQFPNVKTIIISDEIMPGFITMPNRVFPNVDKMIYGDHVSNIFICPDEYDEISWANGLMILANTFCKKENEIIDLNRVDTIMDHAFEGCMSENVINTEAVYECQEHAFDGSIFEKKSKKEDVVMVGSILAYVNHDKDIIELPPNITAVRDELFKENRHIKKLIIHDDSIFKVISPSSICIHILTIKEPTDELIRKLKLYPFGIDEFEIPEDNRDFQTIDGIIYSKHSKELLAFPNNRFGSFNVPDGINRICDNAFAFSNLSSVTFPDSLEYIDSGAFYHSKIESVHFGSGLIYIGVPGDNGLGCFQECRYLKSIEIPSSVEVIGGGTFNYSGLQSVVLHEGLKKIGRYAFYCENLEKVAIPKSVSSIEDNNFVFAEDIHFDSNVPSNYLFSLYDRCAFKGRASVYLDTYPNIRTFHVNGKTFYIPSDITNDSFQKLRVLMNHQEIDEILAQQLDFCKNASDRQDIAIKLYRSNPENDKYKSYLRKNALFICKRYLKEHRTDELVAFLSLDLTTISSLRALLSDPKADSDPVVSSYISTAINRVMKKPDSFRL